MYDPELDLDEAIRRGEVMARFLADETLKKAFAAIDLQYYEQMKAADTREQATAAWERGRALDDLNKVLQGVVDDGVRAQHQLEQRGKASPY